MTNQEKFKTARERQKGFDEFCIGKSCAGCPLRGDVECKFRWLELDAPLTAKEVVNILAKYNQWRMGEGAYGEPGVLCPYTPKQLSVVIDRAVEILRNVKE